MSNIKPKITGEGAESVEELENEQETLTDSLYDVMGGYQYCEEAIEAMRG